MKYYGKITDQKDLVTKEYADLKLSQTGDGSNVTASFTQASERVSISTGEKLGILFGKISKWLYDLKAVAFSGSYTDLSNKPTIPSISSTTSVLKGDGSGNAVAANTEEVILVDYVPIPKPTVSDNGKFLRALNETIVLQTVQNANGVSF